ncbi:FkbM family methyltransferase [Methylicorpusculum sp.]|jgi:FkbM family methyltransferase|uniref:FkbM family methyltransferase n=1 Tax=Methylicorpusculum sp. TaxID=2713644 RepID=UPI002720C8F7|nr:FkbM family methyltransferase [Methylicorpusculum sp.]MDO8843289.1 FkbM family methyltransferase [Methylicorpusculum sp.]
MIQSLKNLTRNFLGLWWQSTCSQEGEDLVLAKIFNARKSGFYVDVGAHHPMRFSNTYKFYKRGWRGINIEPNPEVIGLFKKFRSRDINLNIGIGKKPSTLLYYMFNESALNTFDEALAQKRLESIQYRLKETRHVPIERLDQVLARYKNEFTQIDFMTIDVEGLDFEVLKSNDWVAYRPNWVLVEQLGLSDLSNMDFEIHHFMKEKGYVLFAKTFNTLFYKNNDKSI